MKKTKKNVVIPINLGRLEKELVPGEYNISSVNMMCQGNLEIYKEGQLIASYLVNKNLVSGINIDVKINSGLNIINLEAPGKKLVVEILGRECFS